MELLEYYDIENKEKLGIKERDLVHSENLWHREVAIFIINEKREVLIQKRAATKKQKPNMYAICAGHIDPNEEILDAAVREVYEEIGVKLDKRDLGFVEIYVNNEEGNKHFKYLYIAKINTKIEDMVIQEEELSEVKYITIQELENVIKTHDENYTFSKKEYIKVILEKIKNM